MKGEPMSQKLKEQRLKELAFVGVDTHKDEHTASIANCFGYIQGVNHRLS